MSLRSRCKLLANFRRRHPGGPPALAFAFGFSCVPTEAPSGKKMSGQAMVSTRSTITRLTVCDLRLVVFHLFRQAFHTPKKVLRILLADLTPATNVTVPLQHRSLPYSTAVHLRITQLAK